MNDAFKESQGFSLDELTSDRPSLVRCDLRLIFNHDNKAFNHANVWKFGGETRNLEYMHPFPAMILSPLIINEIAHHPEYTELDFCIHADKFSLLGFLSENFEEPLASYNATPNVHNKLVWLRGEIGKIRTLQVPENPKAVEFEETLMFTAN